MRYEQAVQALAARSHGAHWHGDDAMLQQEFERISTDSRTVQSGELFFALIGERFDGHNFLEQAQAAGAQVAVVSDLEKAKSVDGLSYIQVDDVTKALGSLAHAWRRQFHPKIVAVTGSSGKTTVREMMASILSQKGETLASQGNFNNEIGVPLTLFRLNAKHEYAVIELGANHQGEIAYTVGLTEPDVAFINNVSRAHVEGFGSLEGVAKAKSEIYDGLKEKGVAVVNIDDRFAPNWLELNRERQVLTFSTSKPADVTLTQASLEEDGCYRVALQLPDREVAFKLPLMGRHNIRNALAAVTALIPFEVTDSQIIAGMETLKPVAGRMNPKNIRPQVLVIDDTYNANEGSLRAAIDVLADQQGKKLLCLGELAELGDETESIIANIGSYANEQGIDYLVTVGETAAGAANFFKGQWVKCDTHDQAAHAIAAMVNAHRLVILVKGSRSAKMENVVRELERLIPAVEQGEPQ